MILIVHIRVSKDKVEEFIAATRENAGLSLKEPGISRFEFLQDQADPCRFVLVEGYRDAEAQARHKETAHYARWRDTVAPMMAAPRTSVKFTNLHPDDTGW